MARSAGALSREYQKRPGKATLRGDAHQCLKRDVYLSASRLPRRSLL